MHLVVDRCTMDLDLPEVGQAHVRGLPDVGEGPFPVQIVHEETPDPGFRVDFRIPLEPRRVFSVHSTFSAISAALHIAIGRVSASTSYAP